MFRQRIQRCIELDKSSSLTAHFTDLKTKDQRGKGFIPSPHALLAPPVTLKASCLRSWNIQNTAGASAHKTGNSWLREKNKVTNQREPGTSTRTQAQAQPQYMELGVDFVVAIL